jgi:hypothetical protein
VVPSNARERISPRTENAAAPAMDDKNATPLEPDRPTANVGIGGPVRGLSVRKVNPPAGPSNGSKGMGYIS